MDNELMLFDRLNIIRDTINKYGEENFYISFSGGKDSTILHHLIDEALPNNKIPRVFINTGIEYNDIVKFVREMADSDDRFIITFNRLGRTDEKPDNSTRVSVFNSRNIEDYISATSSYITNMVQLGGYIEEWVYPKTTNEQLLVSNDTAEIIVSKPIIELVKIQVRDNKTGEIADMTDFVYEENVYKTLSIKTNVVSLYWIIMVLNMYEFCKYIMIRNTTL